MWILTTAALLFTYTLKSLANGKPIHLSSRQSDRLSSWKAGDQNMWELSGQIEGDMILLPQQEKQLHSNEGYMWEHNEIPYMLSPLFSIEQAAFINDAVKEFEAKSCLTVRPVNTTDINFVNVSAEDTGCWANVGRLGGPQKLNLQIEGCLTKQTIIHEFLHAAGFHHQHSSPERDSYIKIIWGNVLRGERYNFETYKRDINTGFPYDYGSVMHYSEKAFSANGASTILPHDESWIGRLGNAQEMSNIDVEKLNKMYCNPNLPYNHITSRISSLSKSQVIWLIIGIIIVIIITVICIRNCNKSRTQASAPRTTGRRRSRRRTSGRWSTRRW